MFDLLYILDNYHTMIVSSAVNQLGPLFPDRAALEAQLRGENPLLLTKPLHQFQKGIVSTLETLLEDRVAEFRSSVLAEKMLQVVQCQNDLVYGWTVLVNVLCGTVSSRAAMLDTIADLFLNRLVMPDNPASLVKRLESGRASSSVHVLLNYFLALEEVLTGAIPPTEEGREAAPLRGIPAQL